MFKHLNSTHTAFDTDKSLTSHSQKMRRKWRWNSGCNERCYILLRRRKQKICCSLNSKAVSVFMVIKILYYFKENTIFQFHLHYRMNSSYYLGKSSSLVVRIIWEVWTDDMNKTWSTVMSRLVEYKLWPCFKQFKVPRRKSVFQYRITHGSNHHDHRHVVT
jgi:hypothetical protein